MTKKERAYADMDQMVLESIRGDYTAADLFWARVDAGREYLIELHGNKRAREIWRKKPFWAWWRQTWHINDKKTLWEMRKLGVEKMSWNEYMDTQLVKMHKFKINETVL